MRVSRFLHSRKKLIRRFQKENGSIVTARLENSLTGPKNNQKLFYSYLVLSYRNVSEGDSGQMYFWVSYKTLLVNFLNYYIFNNVI
jgi:hypothetical protein